MNRIIIIFFVSMLLSLSGTAQGHLWGVFHSHKKTISKEDLGTKTSPICVKKVSGDNSQGACKSEKKKGGDNARSGGGGKDFTSNRTIQMN